MYEQRYYIDMTLSQSHVHNEKIMPQVMNNLHRLLRQHKITTLGVGFPEHGSVNLKGKPGFGSIVRLVSVNRDNLRRIANNVTFQTLAEIEIMTISHIKRVPVTTGEVRYFKNNRPHRHMKEMRQINPGLLLSYDDIETDAALVLITRADKSIYPIFVGKNTSDKMMPGEFNTYGLSQQDGATFPEL